MQEKIKYFYMEFKMCTFKIYLKFHSMFFDSNPEVSFLTYFKI